jgi:transcriptional regulator with XRE-family HTH domain
MNRTESSNAVAKILGERIRIRRTSRNLSIGVLAKKAGISKGFLGNIEKGRVQPSIKTLCLLSEALECPIESLLVGVSIPASESEKDDKPRNQSNQPNASAS